MSTLSDQLMLSNDCIRLTVTFLAFFSGSSVAVAAPFGPAAGGVAAAAFDILACITATCIDTAQAEFSSLVHAGKLEAGAIAHGAICSAICWPLLVQAERPQALLCHCQRSGGCSAA